MKFLFLFFANSNFWRIFWPFPIWLTKCQFREKNKFESKSNQWNKCIKRRFEYLTYLLRKGIGKAYIWETQVVVKKIFIMITGFDSTPSQSATDTVQKVKKIVSKLVEESFGESIDVVSTKILHKTLTLVNLQVSVILVHKNCEHVDILDGISFIHLIFTQLLPHFTGRMACSSCSTPGLHFFPPTPEGHWSVKIEKFTYNNLWFLKCRLHLSNLMYRVINTTGYMMCSF